MKSRFDLSEVERFFVEKYGGSIVLKENEYIEISFPDGRFLVTEEEKKWFERLYALSSDCNECEHYLGLSFVISDDEIKEITFLGQNFHLCCLVSVLFELELPEMDDEKRRVFKYACSEIKNFFQL